MLASGIIGIKSKKQESIEAAAASFLASQFI
jgi:Holliday junction resolvase-like predicted endonuclease